MLLLKKFHTSEVFSFLDPTLGDMGHVWMVDVGVSGSVVLTPPN
jgi:hypothetical protein